MSRFKEGKRITAAIEHKNSSELQWALEYCKSRLAFASLKSHIKHWNKQIKNITTTLESIESE